MKLKWYKNRSDTKKALTLQTPTTDSDSTITYPGEVINNIREMITRTNREGKMPLRIAMTSTLRGEGVSYLSMALGATLARDLQIKVCLVEVNWWWPAQNALVPPQWPGLAAVLVEDANLPEVIIHSSIQNFDYIPAGFMLPELRPTMARSKKLKVLIDDIHQGYDAVILDVPAIRATNDSVPLATLAEACSLVIRQKATSRLDIQQALDEISHLHMLGVVMNQMSLATPSPLVKLLSAVRV